MASSDLPLTSRVCVETVQWAASPDWSAVLTNGQLCVLSAPANGSHQGKLTSPQGAARLGRGWAGPGNDFLVYRKLEVGVSK